MVREIRHERYAEWADEVLSVADKVLQGWPAEKSSDAQDFFPTIVHSICISHAERLKAAVTLYRAGLGNHAAPFVRIAYEENTWIYYLATIEDRQLRNELLSRMADLNVMQRVRTQSTFFGQDEAKATGFLGSAHDELAPQFEQNLQSFEELGTKLSWPSRQRGRYQGALPKIAWLAEKRFGEKHPVHGFLAECSSQYVHFSAYQSMRGVTKGPDGSASYSDEFQRGIDSGFALGWLTELLIDCFIPSRTWVSPELDFEDQWLRHWPTQMSRIQNDLRSYGLPALIYAADLVRPHK